jgi:uncharacterized membrane protein (UPF0136 family)
MKRAIGILLSIIAICVFFFRPYFFSNTLLFPSNLLAGFYAPWNLVQYPGWDRGVPFKGLGHDNLLIFYPMKTLLRKAVAEHSFPFWTPYNFTGAPLFGDGQSAVMYPLTLLYIVIPSLPDAFSVMVLLVPFLTMLFTYDMLRHFKLSLLSSLFGAVTFAFCGFMSVWMEENPAVSQSAIWLPLLVWLLDLLITNPRYLWFFLFSLTTAVMMSSGFLQICLYELVFLAAYGIYRIWSLPLEAKEKKARLGLSVLSGVIGLLLVAPYLFTTWTSYKMSPRDFVTVPEIRTIFLVQWSHILSLFNPDWLGNPGSYNFHGVGSYYDKALFIGVVPLMFALIGLFTKKDKREKFFWGMAVATGFMGFSSPVTQWLFAQPIPILSSMLPSRIFYLTSFALAVIAAMAFDRFGKDGGYKQLPQVVRPMAVVYLSIIIIFEIFLISYLPDLYVPDYEVGKIAHIVRTFIVSEVNLTLEYMMILFRNVGVSVTLTTLTAIVLFLAYKIKFFRKVVPIGLLLLTIVSAWYFANKSYYFGLREFVFPNTDVITELQKISKLDRIGFADEPSRIRAATNVIYDLYSPEGLNPVFPYRYGQLIKSSVEEGKVTRDIPRITVDVQLQPAADDPTEAFRIRRLISLLGIRYIVQRKDSAWYQQVYSDHVLLWEGDMQRIWENPDVLPRAFVVPQVVVKEDPQDILDAMYDPSIDPSFVAVVEQDIALPQKINARSTAEIISYRMNDLEIKVQGDGGLLVLTDNFAPGWHALVDGKEAPLYRTNFTFRGVVVPEGEHTVGMYYLPPAFMPGVWTMIGAGILLIGAAFVLKRKV